MPGNRNQNAGRERSARHGGKRVLVVNAFFDEYRRSNGSPYRVPQAMTAHYLAGAFAPERCDVRIHNEQADGVLPDVSILGWPDMLVLTGLTVTFDRLKQLTAYARTLNPKVVVVAGGAAVRALPLRSREIFDYACFGDIEELQAVVRDAFGADYAADEIFPRFDLLNMRGLVAYVESSRYCNFRCSFCSLTGEDGKYLTYDLDYVRRQILAAPKKQIVFIDNNFYGNDRRYFLQRIDMLKELYREGRIKGWSAIVAEDFFKLPENLELMREAGGHTVFSGVESFDEETLRSYNKRQNTRAPQLDTIRASLNAGINFTYGIMLDPSSRTLDSLRREIEFIIDTPDIALPAFFTLSIPLLGTPYFNECVEKKLFMPNVRLRHLDGVTLAMHPLDPVDDVLAFVRDLPSLRGYRRRAVGHTVRFMRRYRATLSPIQLFANMVSTALICTETLASSGGIDTGREPQTYLAETEALDPQYTPAIRIAPEYEHYFRPTMVTDGAGRLADDVADDLASPSQAYPLDGDASLAPPVPRGTGSPEWTRPGLSA